MKTLLFIISLFVTANSFAQLPVWIQKTGKPETKLVVGKAYTKEEIIAKYGEPQQYDTFYDDEIYEATIQHFLFDIFFVETVDNKIDQFSFGSKLMELRMECWNMTIKPGDDINLYRNLPKDKAYHIENFGDHLTLMVTINGNQADIHLKLFYNKEKKIRSIVWFVPV